jgi:hypothetical protein
MTIWDGHGRTPHDTLENILSSGAMLCCIPCLCVAACGKIKLPAYSRRAAKEEQSKSQNGVVSESINKSPPEIEGVEVSISTADMLYKPTTNHKL